MGRSGTMVFQDKTKKRRNGSSNNKVMTSKDPVFTNELLALDSPGGLLDDGSKPVRSHANARERDRTHRWPGIFIYANDTIIVAKTSEGLLLWPRSNAGLCVSVNSAFTALRTLIPTEVRYCLFQRFIEHRENWHNSNLKPADRKLSKIETLRLASSYIAHLGTQLQAGIN